MKKLILKFEIKCGTRGKNGQANSSGKSGPLLSKMKIQG